MSTLGITRERPTHCKHGHEFTPKNTRINRNRDGSFRQYVCRTCAREAQRRAVERKRKSMAPEAWEAHLEDLRAAQRERDRAARRAQGIKPRAEISDERAQARAALAESASQWAERKAEASRERKRAREAAKAQRAAERTERAQRAEERKALREEAARERERAKIEAQAQRAVERTERKAKAAQARENDREATKADEATADQARRERDEQARQEAQEAIMARYTQRYAAHAEAGPFPIVEPVVRVPAACRRGHELTARTVHVSIAAVGGETVPGGVECIRCLREDCFRAHHRVPRTAPVPPEILDEVEFMRQPCGSGHASRREEPWPTDAGWWTRIEFASGWGFCDPDPTPELRAIREPDDDLDEADSARVAAELDELELKDARARREQRAQDANAATAAIRAAMTAARGGVAV
ncbi:hypothetical protein [Tsukamurella strandjordii]|uniref:Uncharacterized protein n=1 Tax=Tsukamurella strandjordii TaxID=147577 RepID=A0AA90NIT2_9ACTN|nr:hypothetical protein [Tsukamurella strandjordii]MDP0399191.1 hypothetical protein [Tsukamurella strandjordii]